jgi:hypothetical protein
MDDVGRSGGQRRGGWASGGGCRCVPCRALALLVDLRRRQSLSRGEREGWEGRRGETKGREEEL